MTDCIIGTSSREDLSSFQAEKIASGLRKSKRINAALWTACCPAHDDKNPSLSIQHNDGALPLVHCHAGCTQEAVIGSLRNLGLWPEKATFKSKIVAEYNYTDAAGNLAYQVIRLSPKEFRQRRPDGKGGWIWKLSGVDPIPYRLPEVVDAEEVWIVEGEKDVETLRGIGLVATCNSGGAGKWTEAHSKWLAGKRVFIIPDADEPGEKHLSKALETLPAARVVRLDGAKDVTDWLKAGGSKERLIKLASEEKEQAIDSDPLKSGKWRAASSFTSRNILWSWRNRLISNGINLLAGMGSVGKDVLCATLAAIVSTGRDWPDGAPCERGNVGYVTSEDDIEDTLKPRLEAAGADIDRVFIYSHKTPPTPEDLNGLKMLIVSPMIEIMADGEMNKEKDVRAFIKPWQQKCREINCCIVGIVHYNKKNDLAAVQRILGSVGMVNAPRSVWCVERDDEDKKLRLFLKLKANLSPDDVDGLQFTIRHIGPYDQSIVCTWLSERTSKSADQVIKASASSHGQSAGEWLKQFLRENGESGRDLVIRKAEEAGHKRSATQKAYERLLADGEVIDAHVGFPSKAYWRLA